MTDPNQREGLIISGVDGGTPLGFLAALGLLQVLEDTCPSEPTDRPRLSWVQLDAWRPVLHGIGTLDEVVIRVVSDAESWKTSRILGFRYVKLEKQGPRLVGGLKAPLAVVRAWQLEQRNASEERALAHAAALFCEAVTDPLKQSASKEDHQTHGIHVAPDTPIDEAVERTFVDFTSRNAQFLEQVELIRAYLTEDLVRAGLERGVPDLSAPRTLDWDPSADTPGSIYTGYQRGFLPVHEWLGFRGLRLFPLAARGSEVRMTASSGRRLRGEFTWPLWERPASLDAVSSLVGYPHLSRLDAERRRALGISMLWSAELTKKADGYTGTFSPARPV